MGPFTASWVGVSFIGAMTLRPGLKPELHATPKMPKHGYQRAWLLRLLAGAANDLFSLSLQGLETAPST
jgi:hypothetical protein